MGLISMLFGRRRTPAEGSVVSIVDAPVGVLLQVESISTENSVRSDRLASLGLVAGCEVTLRQRRPTYVIDVGETTLALDKTIARQVQVRI